MLVLAVPEDLDELLQDGCLAAITALRKLGRIVIMAVNIPIVLIVTILGAEYCRT